MTSSKPKPKPKSSTKPQELDNFDPEFGEEQIDEFVIAEASVVTSQSSSGSSDSSSTSAAGTSEISDVVGSAVEVDFGGEMNLPLLLQQPQRSSYSLK